MIPLAVTDHAENGVLLLTSMFKDRTVIEGMLTAFLNQAQILEDSLWDVILGRSIDSGEGEQLNVIGRIIGEPRGGKEDEEYKYFLKLRILINRADGRVPTLLHIIDVAANGSEWDYRETYPAGFQVDFYGSAEGFTALVSAIGESKGLGIGATVFYAPEEAGLLFVPTSASGGTTNERGPSHTDGLPFSTMMHVRTV